MKKILTAIGASMVVLSMNAQNVQIQNKKGVDLMPVKGDFAIGMNALPALLYIGDLFGSGAPNNALNGNKFVSPFASNTLFGKYMLTDNTAIRVHVRAAFNSTTYGNNLDDDGQVDPVYVVTDTYKRNTSQYNIGAGYEWRRGKTRLRAIYGGELFYQFRKFGDEVYTYGNVIQAGNETPTSTFWDGNGNVLSEAPALNRNLSVTGGNYNGFGIRAFAGLEYFIAPKICVGTEFGWGGKFGKTGNKITEYEYWNGTDNAVVKRKLTEPGLTSANFDTDNFNGAVYFMFYF